MYRGQKGQTLGFESLVKLIKQLAETAHPSKSPQILTKLEAIIQRAIELGVSHQFHAPVLALQIARVTSKLDAPGRYRCVTCGGACENVHAKFVQAVGPVLPYLSPKGMAQLQALYSPCRNPGVWPTTLQLELRNALSIYGALRPRVKDTAELDAEVARQMDLIYARVEAAMPAWHADDSAVGGQHDKFSDIRKQWGNIAKCGTAEHHSTVNLMDVCVAVTSVRDDSPIKALLLYLGNRTIELVYTNDLDHRDIKSLSRIIHCLHKSGHTMTSASAIARIIGCHATNMNVKDLTCLLTALHPQDVSHLDEVIQEVEQILSNAEESKALDIKSMSVLLRQVAKFCEATDNPQYMRIVAICSDAIISKIRRDPASIARREIFTAMVVALRTLYSLSWQPSLQPYFIDMWECCMDYHKQWIVVEQPYDLNEMLSLFADMSSFPRNPATPAMQHPSAKTDPAAPLHEIKEMITVVVRRLQDIYKAAIEKYNQDTDHRDATFMRNLCQFLRILQRHNIKGYYGVDDDFNSNILRLLLKHHADIKPIDAVDISLYLQRVYPHAEQVNDILKQARETAVR